MSTATSDVISSVNSEKEAEAFKELERFRGSAPQDVAQKKSKNGR